MWNEKNEILVSVKVKEEGILEKIAEIIYEAEKLNRKAVELRSMLVAKEESPPKEES